MIHNNFKPNSSGMVLVVVVILAAVAGILAAGLHFASSSRIIQVRQEIRFDKAFFVAEAGIERAKDEVRYRATNLNNVFTNGGMLFGGVTNYGEGRYSVQVTDNADSNASLFIDTDHIVIIRSTGIVETATRVIEVEIKVVPFEPGMADGALALYGTNTALTVSGNGGINGADYNPPADFGDTGIHAGGTLSGNPEHPGVFCTATGNVVTNTGSGEILGNPPQTNGVGIYDEAYWYQLYARLIAIAPIYVDGSLGTRANPALYMLPLGTTEINPSDNVAGAGILIVPSYSNLRIRGTFYYEGLIIIEGQGDITCESETELAGTSRIFGAMVCIGGALAVDFSGTSDMKYSEMALANLSKLEVPAQLDMIYWKEIKASSTNW